MKKIAVMMLVWNLQFRRIEYSGTKPWPENRKRWTYSAGLHSPCLQSV